jgi:hypothetical protein
MSMLELEQGVADVFRESERDKDPEYWKGLYLGMVAAEHERKIKEAERKRKRGMWKEAVLLVALGAGGTLLLKVFIL